MTQETLERRRFRALLGRLKETLAAPYVVTYDLVNRDTLIEREERQPRGFVRLYFDGQEMNIREFSALALKQALETKPPAVSVIIARHHMRNRSGVTWYIYRVIDPKIDLAFAWIDLPIGVDITSIVKPYWVDDDITENPNFTPMGIALQACDFKGIPRP